MSDVVVLIADKLGLPLWLTVILGLVALTALPIGGYIYSRVRDWVRHKQLEFPDAVLIQRTTVRRGKLAIRTLKVRRLGEIVLDPHLARIIEAAGKRTTEDFPAVVLSDSEQHAQMWTDVMNAVSPYIPKGTPPQLVSFTRERYAKMFDRRQRNVFRLLISSEHWTKLFEDVGTTPDLDLEDKNHDQRLERTLPWIARMWFKHAGVDPKSEAPVIKRADSPWDDDEPTLLKD